MPAPPDPCPICAAQTRAYTSKHAFGETWRIRRCTRCGHGFVANRPSLQRLEEIYAAEGSAMGLGVSEVTRADLERHPDAQPLARLAGAATAVRGPSLDVGSGGGAFSYRFHAAGFRPNLLIDFDERAAGAVRHIPGASFRRAAFEEIGPSDGPFGAIIMSQVLEHALDPADWARRAFTLLAPPPPGSPAGGVLAIALPNFGGVYRLLGARDPFLIPPVHLNFFTPRSLATLLTREGFAIARVCSRSNVSGASPARRAWNALSRPLNLTARGIILWAVAVRPR